MLTAMCSPAVIPRSITTATNRISETKIIKQILQRLNYIIFHLYFTHFFENVHFYSAKKIWIMGKINNNVNAGSHAAIMIKYDHWQT